MSSTIAYVSAGALFLAVMAQSTSASHPMGYGDEAPPQSDAPSTAPPVSDFAPQSVTQIRSGLDAGEFVFDLNEATQVPGDGVLLQVGDLTTFRALALEDIQMSAARVTMDDGAVNPTHIHPRGTEMLYVTKGTLDVFISAEAGNDMIENTVETGEFTVFPQGIPHGQTCVKGKGPCEFVATFNSPNAGAVSPVTVG